MNKPSLLVIGAGYVGLEAARQFRGAGYQATLARRSVIESDDFASVVCDVTDVRSVAGLPEVEAIFYAVSAGESSDVAYEKAYFTGVRNVVDTCLRWTRRPRFYLVSSTSVYAESKGGPLDEETGELVTSGLSRKIVQGEQLLRESGLSGGILRCGGIYGPGRTRFLERVNSGVEKVENRARSYTNRIHRDDIAGVALFLDRQDRPGMTVLNVVDRISEERNAVLKWLANELGIKLPHSDAESGTSGKQVNAKKLQDLGYKYIYPTFREGYAPLVKTLQASRKPER